MSEFKPGSFGLSVIEGKTGRFVKWGQDIVDGRKEKYTHSFFVLNNDEVIEAEPGGAQIVSMDKYRSRPADTVWITDAPVENAVHEFVMDNGGYVGYPHGVGVPVYADAARVYEIRLRMSLVHAARVLGPGGKYPNGIPYNYLDYLAIGLEHFKIDLPIVRNRVRREDRMICSQLVDYIYKQNGIHLFTDGRLPQDVTPGDLETWIYRNSFGVL